MTPSRPDLADPLLAARRAFEGWRSAPERGRRVPESLWKIAVDLAREQGVSKTALALGDVPLLVDFERSDSETLVARARRE